MATGVVGSTPATVATSDKDTPEKEPVKLESKGKKVSLSAVYGDIYHPFDNTKFTVDAYRPHELDSWVQIQLDAGKLKREE